MPIRRCQCNAWRDSAFPSGRGAHSAWTPERQLRLTAPIFKTHKSLTTSAAGASLRSSVSKSGRARGSTETPCHFSNRGGARWEGSGLISRLRAGSIPAPATNFMGRSIIQEVTRLASGNALRGSANSNWPRSAHCIAAGAAKHGAKPWRSTFFKSREG